MLRIQNVKVPLGKDNYKKIISQTLNIREKQIKDVKLVKQSIDARRDHVHFIVHLILRPIMIKNFLNNILD